MSTAAPRGRHRPDEFTVGLYHSTHGEEQNYRRSALEDDLIKQLCAQAYEYADIHDYDGPRSEHCASNEALNDYRFSDGMGASTVIRSLRLPPPTGTPSLPKPPHTEDHVRVLTRDDGTPKNISLIDKTNDSPQQCSGVIRSTRSIPAYARIAMMSLS